MKNGYTLIELVIVVGLTAILTVSITAIMMSSLLSSRRVRTQVSVRQAGDYAITQMERMIRGAQSFPIVACDPATSPNQISFNNFDGKDTTFSKITVGDVDLIASSSALTATTEYITPDNMHITAFSITCDPPSGIPDLVTISFTIENYTPTLVTSPFDKVSVVYKTSIKPRNN